MTQNDKRVSARDVPNKNSSSKTVTVRDISIKDVPRRNTRDKETSKRTFDFSTKSNATPATKSSEKIAESGRTESSTASYRPGSKDPRRGTEPDRESDKNRSSGRYDSIGGTVDDPSDIVAEEVEFHKKYYNGEDMTAETSKQKKELVKKIRHIANQHDEIIYLFQKDFSKGSYIMDKPAVYKLKEDIEINFPENDSFAIQCKSNKIVIDLGGFTIKQSYLHALKNRSFSIIKFEDIKYVYILNGVIGRSSNYGIFGNKCANILIEKIKIIDFERSGMSFRDVENAVTRKLKIGPNCHNLPVLSTYDTALRLPQFYAEAKKIATEEEWSKLKPYLVRLRDSTKMALEQINDTGTTTIDPYSNESQIPDRSVSAISFSGKNKNVYMEEISVARIDVHPVEVIGISQKNGWGIQVDSTGAILNVESVMNEDGIYVGNPLANAQLELANFRLSKGLPCDISPEIIYWYQNSTPISSLFPNSDSDFSEEDSDGKDSDGKDSDGKDSDGKEFDGKNKEDLEKEIEKELGKRVLNDIKQDNDNFYRYVCGCDAGYGSDGKVGSKTALYNFENVTNLHIRRCIAKDCQNTGSLGDEVYEGAYELSHDDQEILGYQLTGLVGFSFSKCLGVYAHEVKSKNLWSWNGFCFGYQLSNECDGICLNEVSGSGIKAGYKYENGKWLGISHTEDEVTYTTSFPNTAPKAVGLISEDPDCKFWVGKYHFSDIVGAGCSVPFWQS